MMKHINQKHGLPRVPKGKNLLLRRSAIIKGQVPTYFGPGQLPNCGPGYGLRMADNLETDDQPVDIETAEILRVYTPPTDWPKEGSLLRAPQVVWLGHCLKYWNVDYLFSYTDDWYPIGIHRYNLYPCGHVKTGVPYGPIAVDHPEQAEHARLVGVFAEVKSRIETLRPNRTWVTVLDWLDTTAAGTHGYQIANNFPHLAAPPWSEADDLEKPTEASHKPYFGVRFLHVFAGVIFEDRKIEANNYVRIVADTWADLADNPSHADSADRIKAATHRFSAFRVMLFPPDLKTETIPTYAYTSDMKYVGFPGEQYLDLTSPPATDPGWYWPDDFNYCITNLADAVSESAAAITAAAALRSSTINDALDAYRVTETARYFASAKTNMQESLDAINAAWDTDKDGVMPVSIEGTTGDLTVESLIALIAHHFGFDKDTGKDLPDDLG